MKNMLVTAILFLQVVWEKTRSFWLWAFLILIVYSSVMNLLDHAWGIG